MAGTVVEVAVSSEAFPTLVAAVQAAGLVETLSSEGPFTVLAPTEDAFAAALAALDITPEALLADTELLTAVLTYHVLPLEAPAEVVLSLDGQSVATVNGAEITITVDGDTVMVNNATVVATDIAASNGIIHVQRTRRPTVSTRRSLGARTALSKPSTAVTAISCTRCAVARSTRAAPATSPKRSSSAHGKATNGSTRPRATWPHGWSRSPRTGSSTTSVLRSGTRTADRAPILQTCLPMQGSSRSPNG